MSRKVAWVAAGVAGLLAAGGATAATAATATAVPPVAAPHWHIVKSVKTNASGDFTAVVATGKTTGWAFDGQGFGSPPTAWRRNGTSWTKFTAFPGKKNEEVVTAGASSPSNVWAFTTSFGAGSRVLHWNGAKWSVARTFSAEIDAASVLSVSDVWVFGFIPEPGTPTLGVWHYNGHTWTRVSKSLAGGSALSPSNVWAFGQTSVAHWDGLGWTSTSVKALLPAKTQLNDPSVVGIRALSARNVYAIGNGNAEDEGGPLVVLHYNGSKWAKVAQGRFGTGPGPQFSSDGSGGLWLPMSGPVGGPGSLVHYTGGNLIKATLPVGAASITIGSVARVPGTTQQLAGGFTHAKGNLGAKVVAVILQYS
jgi:hypothetical protein